MTKEFWKATGVRCLRTFLTTILGVWTGGQLITEVDWKFTFISAVSTTVYIFITCILAGLPEVKLADTLYALDNDGEIEPNNYIFDEEDEDIIEEEGDE